MARRNAEREGRTGSKQRRYRSGLPILNQHKGKIMRDKTTDILHIVLMLCILAMPLVSLAAIFWPETWLAS